jgi:phosphoglycerol transferase
LKLTHVIFIWIFILVVIFSSLLLGLSTWIYLNFGPITFEQFLFNANQGLEISELVAPELVKSFVLFVLVVPSIFVFLYSLLILLMYKFEAKSAFRYSLFFLTFIFFVSSLFISNIVLKFTDYIEFMSYDSVIDDFYSEPIFVQADSENQSLILIYVESLDANFSEKEIYGENLLENLEESTNNWTNFPNYTSDWQGFTIGSLVTTQCGIPLLQSSEIYKLNDKGLTSQVDGNDFGSTYEKFLPGATCLGDVLKDAGYLNVFMGGADANYAGKGKFLSEHGYGQIFSRSYWEASGEDYFNSWGLPDDRLLENARDVVLELRQKPKPYNLTLLTLDTHVGGEPSETCSPDKKVVYLETLKCSSELLAEFLNWLDAQGVYEDTNVVVIGDHLHMGNDEIRNQLASTTQRSVFNRFYSPNKLTPNRNHLSQVDIFPSILTMLGFESKDGYGGLGASVFGDYKFPKGLVTDIPNIYERAQHKSKLIDSFWK